MICPRCNYDLVTIDNCGEEITWCQNCRGKWLEQNDPEKMVGKDEGDETSKNDWQQNPAFIEHYNTDSNDTCNQVHPKKEKNIFSNFLTFR